jgi:hypothetical protein
LATESSEGVLGCVLGVDAVTRKAFAHFLRAGHLLKDVLARTLSLITQSSYFFQLPVTPNARLKNLVMVNEQVVNANFGNSL